MMDRITILPNPILSDILSLMPLKYAVRTSILSRGWRHQWKHIPHLCFHRDEYNEYITNAYSFPYTVSKVLLLHNGPLDSLIIYGGAMNESEISEDKIANWIRDAIRLSVRIITLSRVPVPISCFKYRNLVELTIEGKGIKVQRDEIDLPNLKKMKLLSNNYFDEQTIPNLVSGCSAIEELCVQGYGLERDSMIRFSVSSSTLKKLHLDFMDEKICDVCRELVLDIPAVQHLSIEDCCADEIQLEDILCLDVADIFLQDYLMGGVIKHSENVFQFFKKLHNARKLTLWTYAELLVRPVYVMTSSFLNLRDVELSADLYFVTILLEKAPILESLTIQKLIDQEEESWKEPRTISACLSSTLNNVSFHRLTDGENELSMLSYILGHGRVLKRMEILWGKLSSIEVGNGQDQLMKTFDKVCSFPRASATCALTHKFKLRRSLLSFESL